MSRTLKSYVPLICFSLFCFTAFSQDKSENSFGDGIRLLAADSSFSVKFSARIQSLYEGNVNLRTNDYVDGFEIRRARLKFDGFAYSPRLEYKIELALSNSDLQGGAIPQSGNISSIVLDAYVTWNFWRKWSLIFGQKKLPGNRERVISSQEVQFVDRSNLNSRFNLDRGVGMHLLYNSEYVNLIGALTMGEGRNIIVENIGGYDYTVRGEYLPFGPFTDEGDYFGSDLAREPDPKLSVAMTYDFIDGASRTRGQLGDFVPVTRDLYAIIADAHFKYRGFSTMAEYVNKKTSEGPLVYDAEGNFLDAFYTGEGFNLQSGYLFRNNIEIAARYTRVSPEAITGRDQNTEYTFNLSRYFVGHNLKVQTDVSYIEEDNNDDFLRYRLKLEFAF